MPPLKAEETRLLFRNIDEQGLASIKTYRKFGGYQSIRKAYEEMTPEEVLKELEDSGLRGRGGAGFSMGKKASFLPRGDMDKYLCCNADESEPGAFKDRELMQKNPHQLIEGLIIAARAAGANRCFIYIRGEYDLQGDILEKAVEEAYEAGLPRRGRAGHRRSRWSWSSTAARAPTSAARRRRCSTRSRASGAIRASSRRSRPSRVSTAGRR